MEEMKILKEILEKEAYRVVDGTPKRGEVCLRMGINMKCPILESQEEDRDEIHLMLKNLGYRTMIRLKENGVCQFIIKK